MTASINIRIAKKRDLASIQHLWAQLKKELPSHHFQPFGAPVDCQQQQQLTEVLDHCYQRDDAVIYVAEAEQLIGTLAAIENYQTGYEKPESAVLFNLWVDPLFRRNGVATLLYQHARAWLEERDIQSVQAGWHPGNTASDQFWRQLGFRSYEVIGAVALNSMPLK